MNIADPPVWEESNFADNAQGEPEPAGSNFQDISLDDGKAPQLDLNFDSPAPQAPGAFNFSGWGNDWAAGGKPGAKNTNPWSVGDRKSVV